MGTSALRVRLQRDLAALISTSAEEHGIRLTASFRPFETALTKYYEIPTFDQQGEYLWGFLPLATPVVNYHPEHTGFAHFRTILREMGHEDRGRIGALLRCPLPYRRGQRSDTLRGRRLALFFAPVQSRPVQPCFYRQLWDPGRERTWACRAAAGSVSRARR